MCSVNAHPLSYEVDDVADDPLDLITLSRRFVPRVWYIVVYEILATVELYDHIWRNLRHSSYP